MEVTETESPGQMIFESVVGLVRRWSRILAVKEDRVHSISDVGYVGI